MHITVYCFCFVVRACFSLFLGCLILFVCSLLFVASCSVRFYRMTKEVRSPLEEDEVLEDSEEGRTTPRGEAGYQQHNYYESYKMMQRSKICEVE